MTLSSVHGDRLVFRLVGVLSLFGIVAGLYFGHELFVPIALAVLFTFVLLPSVTLLQRTGLPRLPSVVVTVVLAFGLLGAMGYFVVGQLAGLASKIPEYKENIHAKVKSINEPLSRAMRNVQGTVDEMKKGSGNPGGTAAAEPPSKGGPVKVEVVEGGADTLRTVTGVLGPLAGVAGSAAIVIFLVIFFLIYQNEIRDRLIRLAGGTDRVTLASQTLGDAVQGVSRFLFLQAILNLSHGLAFGIGLFALGVPNALLWGFSAMLLRFIPYLGPIVAGLLPLLLSIAIFPGWGRPILVAGFVVGLEIVSNNFVEPWVYGKRTGLSPFMVVLAAIFWAWLWGPMGLLLSVPLTVCLMTLGKYVPGLGFLAVLLGEEPAFGPDLQVYNRLLMGNIAEAAEVVEKGAEGKSLSQTYDAFLIPALRLAEEARVQGRLDSGRMEALLAAVAELQKGLWDATRRKSETAERSKAREVGILCLPAGDKADAAAGSMLAQALSLQGFRAEAATSETLAAEKIDLVEKGEIDIVVLSAIPSSTPAPGRYLYKKLRKRFPEIPIVFGVWGVQGDLKALESRLAPDGHAAFAGTLDQAERAIQALARSLVLIREQDAESPVATTP